MSRPSILFMNRVYPPVRGATGRLLSDLACEYARKGWSVTVIASGNVAGKEHKDGVRILRVKGKEAPTSSLSYMLIWMRMLLLGLRLKPCDVLVTLSDPPMIIVAGSIIAKLKKSRHVNWCHDLYPDIIPALGIKMPNFLLKNLRLLRIKAMKSCDKIVVCGRCMMKHITREGVGIQKIKVIANWANRELINYEHKIYDGKLSRGFARRVKNSKRFQVLYAGNIGLAHPIDVVLDAAKILEDRGYDIDFLFVGSGERFDYIADLRAQMCLDNVRLLPYQPVSRLRDILEGGDIHLATMNEEAAGLMVPSKIYSAFAVARPCIFIGFENCEAAQIVSDFGAGLAVPQDDAESLVNAILYFRQSDNAWLDAHNGAIRANAEFKPDICIAEWMNHVGSVGGNNESQ